MSFAACFGKGWQGSKVRRLLLGMVFLQWVCLLSSPGYAQTFADSRFGAETVVTLPAFTPVGVTFAPDGRMFIWQKNGIVRIYKNGVLLGEPFLDISSKVNNFHDRGLLGFALDPNFATNGYAYLFYTYEDRSTPSNGAKTVQLIRVTADPANPDVALPSSEVVLLGAITAPPCSSHPAGSDCIPADAISHTVGMIRFLSDGTLLLSNGDGSDFNAVNSLALRAQDLNSYAGKILRIRPDGTAPPDNPFYDGTNSIRSKVYAYGLRNPYRFLSIGPLVGPTTAMSVGTAGRKSTRAAG
jgi:glucose/arabinose dehydrogenase